MNTVAIHQVNFFPWLPFFHKISKADNFILLDDVQYERTGAGSWQNRVRLAVQGSEYWLTCPLDRSVPRTARINDMRIHPDKKWKIKALTTLELHYKKAMHFEHIYPIIRDLILFDCDNLAQYNENAIRTLSKLLGLHATIWLSSNLPTESTRTQRLIDLAHAVEADSYYSGKNAARTYQLSRESGLQRTRN